MNSRIAFTIITLALTSNSNAGWLEDLSNSGDKIQQELQNLEGIDTTSVQSALSNEDIIAGLKEALIKGVGYAVDNLGQADGFLGNTDVKIPMPKKLKNIESLLRQMGNDKYADEFITTMNRAAESAVPLTLEIIKSGITSMSIDDANNILNGPDDAATKYLRKTGYSKLSAKILPIVKNATSKNGVTAGYKKMIDNLGFAGKYINLDDYDIDNYVTKKTMSGLFTMIAKEEKEIRDNPAARTTDILKSVFGYN